MNALTAADAVLIPIQCEYYALEGLTQLTATVNLVRDHLNPGLEINGVVLTMYDARTKLSAEVADEVRRHLGSAVYDTVIPRSVRLSEAPSYGQPIALYRADSRGAEAYASLAAEFDRESRVNDPNPARPSTPSRQEQHDRPFRTPERTRARPRRADPPAQRRPRPDRGPSRAHPAEPAPAAATHGRGGARGARREHHRPRRPPADPRDADPRRLPDRGRGAAVPRRAARRARADPGRHPPARRTRPARAGPRREPPARRPRPGRRGARLPAADRRVRVDATGRRRASRSGPIDRREHPPPARS